jgi:MoxR-like ATPase
MSLAASAHDVRTLLRSFHPVLAIETAEEERAGQLLRTVAHELGWSFFQWSITRGLTAEGHKQALFGTTEPLGALQHIQGLTVDAIFWLKDLAPHLDDPIVARKLREVAIALQRRDAAMVLTGARIELPEDVDHLTAHYEMRMPSRDELRDVIRSVLASLGKSSRIEVTLGPDDLEPVLDALSGLTLNQARQAIARVVLEDGQLGTADIERLQRRKAEAVGESGLLEYFPVQDNAFELAGFASLKQWLERAKLGFSPEARELNLTPPRGILLVGVQGCGKSLSAKVIAREWGLPLLKLDAGQLLDKYVGESEKNLRRATSLAESMAPCVLWIDEIEKSFARTGDEDGGVSRRLLGGFLTWLQERRADVFVVATANDVFALPPELVRKGRFDELFFVDLPAAVERAEILRVHLRARKQDPKALDVDAIVLETEGFSGAELEQAVVAALYRALHEKAPLSTEHLLEEIRGTRPLSVSRREDIERLRELARERFVPVS